MGIPCPQCRAGENEPFQHDLRQVDLGLVAVEEGDLHDPALDGCNLEIAVGVITAHHVENDIDALLVGLATDDLDKVLVLVVDRHVRTEIAHHGTFFVGARGREYGRAERLGELDGRCPDARGSAMDEESLARLERGAIKDVRPDREECFGDRGGFRHRQPAWDRQCVARVGDAILRIATARHQGTNLIANLPACDLVPDRLDLAGDFQPRNVWRARRRWIIAGALHAVRPVDACSVNLDQDLSRLRFRLCTVLGNQNFRSARFGDGDRAHVSLLCVSQGQSLYPLFLFR